MTPGTPNLLDTVKYAADCERVFGRLLDRFFRTPGSRRG